MEKPDIITTILQLHPQSHITPVTTVSCMQYVLASLSEIHLVFPVDDSRPKLHTLIMIFFYIVDDYVVLLMPGGKCLSFNFFTEALIELPNDFMMRIIIIIYIIFLIQTS